LDYILFDRPAGDGLCADNECPCNLTPIPQGKGYIYVSPEVIDFRKDALSQTELQAKLAPYTEKNEYIPASRYEPMLICEQAAIRRNLDIEVAANDAREWWETGKVPLRITPQNYRDQSSPLEPQPSVGESDNKGVTDNQPFPDAIFPDSVGNASFVDDTPAQEQNFVNAIPDTPPPAENMPFPDDDFSGGNARFVEDAPQPSEDAFQSTSEPSSIHGSSSLEETVIGNADFAPAKPDENQQEESQINLSPYDEPDESESSGSSFVDKIVAEQGLKIFDEQKKKEEPPRASISPESIKNPYAEKKGPPVEPKLSPAATPRPKKKGIHPAILWSGIVLTLILAGVSVSFLLFSLASERQSDNAKELEKEPVNAIDSMLAMDLNSDGGEMEEGEESSSPPVQTKKEDNKNSKVLVNKEDTKTTSGRISRSFFTRAYAFVDTPYRGVIRFSDLSSEGGRYYQEVKIGEKNKIYKVRGSFTFSNDRIQFNPDAAENDVMWQLKSGAAGGEESIFFDPHKKGGDVSDISLRILH